MNMKYKVGDELFFKDYGTEFKKCTVIKVLENSGRYRVKYPSLLGDKEVDYLKHEKELFPNTNECIDFYISVEELKKEYIQKQIDALNSKRIK